MMSDLGAQVTILEALPKILPGCDDDVANVVVRSFKKRGIEIRTGVPVDRVTSPSATAARPCASARARRVDVDLVVVSVGRRPLADLLGLDGTGSQVDERGFVEVDELCRTGEPGVYAVGDLIATPQLAHVGFAEAIIVDQGHPRRGPGPGRLRQGAVVHLLPSRGRVRRATPRRRPRRPASTSSTSKHRYSGNGRALIVGETEGW